MKHLSITLRVTLLYTLFMVLLATLSLGVLSYAGAQTARQGTLTRMQTMAGAAAMENPPKPTVSAMALSPRSGLASAALYPGK